MQIHEAATQYLVHREALDNYGKGICADDCVWGVEYFKIHDAYHLVLHFALGESPDPDDPDTWMDEYSEARHITKQRGGTRLFKTLDAVASALQQIGQPVMPLDRLNLL